MHAPVSEIRLKALDACLLGISEEQRESLIWFVEEVEAGNIREAPPGLTKFNSISEGRFSLLYNSGKRPKYFAMNAVHSDMVDNEDNLCGTAGCVLGWCKHHNPAAFPVWENGGSVERQLPNTLRGLFFLGTNDTLTQVWQRVRNLLLRGDQYRND